MGNPIKSRRSRKLKVLRYGKDKIAKPWKGFPLQAHPTGRWSKKIRGKLRHFGRWGRKDGDSLIVVDDVEASARAALNEFNRQWPYLSEGKTPPSVDAAADGGCTLRELCNAFWRSKRAKMHSGELSPRTFTQYEKVTDLLIAHWGKDRRVDEILSRDFEVLRSELDKRYGKYGLKSSVVIVRMVFKFGWDHRRFLGIKEPADYGQSFDIPSAKTIRRKRRDAGERMFEAHKLRTILDALDGEVIRVEGEDEPVTFPVRPAMKAMVLLGVNCGFGNTDVSSLPQSAVDLENGWIDFPRPKTEVERRVPLWPETVEALKAAIAIRPRPASREYGDHCFLTWTGLPYTRMQPHAAKSAQYIKVDGVSEQFGKLLKRLKINGRRGLNFYTLRHVFETIGGEARDQVAVNAIMGHVDTSMAAQYRERISDERLRRVTEHVREWLYAAPKNLTDGH